MSPLYLLDTHLLIWAASDDPRLPDAARALIMDRENEVAFSAASIWEVSIKHANGRRSDMPEPLRFRRRLLAAGYHDLPVTSAHALAVATLPTLHRDPFDRLLLAQAMVEDAMLLTVDRTLAAYPGPVRFVG